MLCPVAADCARGREMTEAHHLTLGEVGLRLGAATAIGLAIGLEREVRRKPVGMRTLALVSLGSSLMAVVGADLVAPDGRPDQHALSRVIQGIVAGIGFLGAGVILRNEAHQSVQGLTTAAAVWVSASLGIA